MNKLIPFFPQAFRVREPIELVIALVIYVLIGAIGGLIIGFLSKIWLIGFLFSLVGIVIDVYALVGVVLSILVFCKVI
ncbi:MAG: hypothetical protein E7580_08665 [Ruminococcaceae bacterium]|nr:hypothetical protein [Oscillospiraceae bacterium]